MPTHVAVTGKAACVPGTARYVPVSGGRTVPIFKMLLKQLDVGGLGIQGG
jgi:hypothetical protein